MRARWFDGQKLKRQARSSVLPGGLRVSGFTLVCPVLTAAPLIIAAHLMNLAQGHTRGQGVCGAYMGHGLGQIFAGPRMVATGHAAIEGFEGTPITQ